MALERGSIGKGRPAVIPLSTGFVYEPYDEKKHGLSPDYYDAIEVARQLSTLWQTRPTSENREWRNQRIDELERRRTEIEQRIQASHEQALRSYEEQARDCE
jgi:methylthioribose-1-phosphate isomerase